MQLMISPCSGLGDLSGVQELPADTQLADRHDEAPPPIPKGGSPVHGTGEEGHQLARGGEGQAAGPLCTGSGVSGEEGGFSVTWPRGGRKGGGKGGGEVEAMITVIGASRLVNPLQPSPTVL